MGYKGKFVPGELPSYGAIFMSNSGTKKECFQRKLLGLPLAQSNFVLHVKKGMILFLFEFERRQLHGVFRATSNGEMNIEPNAFKSSGKSFPAQVRFTPVWNCKPLGEHEFMDAIRDNYFSGKKFKFGLSKNQVHKLITLFHSKRIPKKPTEGDSRFVENRKNFSNRIRFVNEEDDHGFDNDEVRTFMKERSYKDNKEEFLTNYTMTQRDDFGKISVASNDDRRQDEYHIINGFTQTLSPYNLDRGSKLIDDGGYFGHETLEREQRRLTEYEQKGTDYGIKLSSDEYFGLGDISLNTHNSLSHFNQNNSDFIPVSEFSEQFQHPFEFNNIQNTYEQSFHNSTSSDPSMITLHTPYNPELPEFCHKPYNSEVPEFCHKSSYFTPVGNPPFYPSETIPYHSETNHSSDGKFTSNYVRKVSVFDRLSSIPKTPKHEKEIEKDEQDELDVSVNKVMKMLEKIVSSPIKRTGKRQSSFKQDDDDDNKIMDYEFPNTESKYEGIKGDELAIQETRVVDFKRRKKTNKNIDDENKEKTNKDIDDESKEKTNKDIDDENKEKVIESDVGMSRKRRKKLVRPVFVKKESITTTFDENTSLKVESLENIKSEENGKVVEERTTARETWC